MKSMRLPLAAIFFMTYFDRAGEVGGIAPSAPPPGSVTVSDCPFLGLIGEFECFRPMRSELYQFS